MRLFRKKMRVPAETNGDALVAIAQEDPGALKLVGDIMERNAAENARVMEQQLEMERRWHQETASELREVRHELNVIRRRVAWLLGGDMPDEIVIKIEQIAEETAEQVVERERTVAL